MIKIHLMGLAYKPNGRQLEELAVVKPLTVKEALKQIGYPDRGLDFFIPQRDQHIIRMDSLLNDGDEIFIYMPVGGG